MCDFDVLENEGVSSGRRLRSGVLSGGLRDAPESSNILANERKIQRHLIRSVVTVVKGHRLCKSQNLERSISMVSYMSPT